MFWLILIVAIGFIIGNAMLLLRTDPKPKLPADYQPKALDEEDEGW